MHAQEVLASHQDATVELGDAVAGGNHTHAEDGRGKAWEIDTLDNRSIEVDSHSHSRDLLRILAVGTDIVSPDEVNNRTDVKRRVGYHLGDHRLDKEDILREVHDDTFQEEAFPSHHAYASSTLHEDEAAHQNSVEIAHGPASSCPYSHFLHQQGVRS